VASYDSLKKKQTELIRKALDGSAFIAPYSAAAIASLTIRTAGPNGIVGDADDVIELAPLPTGYADLGYLTDDGVGFARDVATSDITSWGSVTPTRTDITADTTTVTVTAQETNLYSIGIATGKDFVDLKDDAAAFTNEIRINKPARPNQRFYRLFTLAVDSGTAEGDIWIARFLPRCKVTAFGDQSYGGGDAPIEWPVTLQGYVDSALGYSEAWLFGGPGWKSLMDEMGFTPAA
jgi:hypothetical protein